MSGVAEQSGESIHVRGPLRQGKTMPPPGDHIGDHLLVARVGPTSKNSAVITPRSATSVAAISRCHACDVTGSWNSAVDVRP